MLLPAWSILCTLLPVAAVSGSKPPVIKAVEKERPVITKDLQIIKKDLPAIKPDTPVIKLVFVMDDRPDDPEADTLFYPTRKLRWPDFKGTPPLRGPSAAVSFTSFSYEGHSRLLHDTLQITLTLQVFFIRSASWARVGIKDNYSLGHEQLHFDITCLVAQRFKQRIRSLPLTREDYDSMIQFEYLEAFREMNQLQYEYDGDTRNGTNAAAQYDWQKRIARDLEITNGLP